MNEWKKNLVDVSRELLFSVKGESTRKRLVVRVQGPFLLKKNDVGFDYDEGTCVCKIVFEGLEEPDVEVFGMDGLQALRLATDVDPYLRGLSNMYDFFWTNGESYFE